MHAILHYATKCMRFRYITRAINRMRQNACIVVMLHDAINRMRQMHLRHNTRCN